MKKSDDTLEIRLENRSDGHNKYYTIRAERNLFPTLARQWGGSTWSNSLSLINTFRSIDELDQAIRQLIRRRLNHGYQVVSGQQWIELFLGIEHTAQQKSVETR